MRFKTQCTSACVANKKSLCHWVIMLALLLACGCTLPQAQAQTFTLLHSFTGGRDGATPIGALARDAAGNLYGAAEYSGDPSCSCGVVFKLDVSGHYTVLRTFTTGQLKNGYSPYGDYPQGVTLDDSGNIYGTTFNGGNDCLCGDVFALTASGKETVLHRFNAGSDGGSPTAAVTRDSSGNLYGTTGGGGPNSAGTVYKLTASGNESILYRFTGKSDGGTPYAGLTRDSVGNLYGTTNFGGSMGCTEGCGTVFKIDAAGNYSVLYRFRGGTDGSQPEFSPVVRDPSGNLYGTTQYGGAGDCECGTIFKVSAAGKETILHTFTRGDDGATPFAGVIRDSAENLYGTTEQGGAFNQGTVFKLDPSGNLIVLHAFDGSDGRSPGTALIRDSDGTLYGTAFNGGTTDNGVIFKITP
jgi:uncharacterized repeat protein (TIGR03803 family)